LSSFQTNRFVVLPQAVRNVTPPLLNDFISLQKDTALVAVLGPIEVLRRAQIDTSSNFNYTPYVGAALIFIALTIPMTRFADWMAVRSARKRQAGGAT
jgi:polar amino acid transport system permease protein